ncbi:Protein of unknown function [Bacillus wiedmannii]|uniref:Uncharacterized protein n=1 Tax=Bacillus wiedmannii TaxID=1890302 RepID=A0AB37YZ50_9BACI|nr:Protein of unknown function [Bacillus wiedmannii]
MKGEEEKAKEIQIHTKL